MEFLRGTYTAEGTWELCSVRHGLLRVECTRKSFRVLRVGRGLSQNVGPWGQGHAGLGESG